MQTVIRSCIAAGLLLASASYAHAAGPVSANLNVQATIVDLCSVNDATLSFGVVNPILGLALPATGIINVTCSIGTVFSVGLGDGLNFSGGSRRMKKNGDSAFLNYNLYRDLTLLSPFGDTGSSDRSAGVGLGIAATPVTVWGTVPTSQNAPAGDYADTVQINVYY